MSKLRLMLLGTAAFGLVAAAMSTASAGEVEKVASFSGGVNRTLIVADDGDATSYSTQDDTSTLTFKGSATSESLTTGAYIQLGAYGGETSAATGTSTAGSVAMRHSYVTLSNSMGTLDIGQTNRVGDGGASSDMTGAATGWDARKGTDSHAFIVKNAGATNGLEESLATVASATYVSDLGRGSVINYSSPDFNGFSVKLGLSDQDNVGADLKYSADFDGTAVKVAVSGSNEGGDSTTIDTKWTGSAGIKLASGISAYVGYAEANMKASGASNPDTWAVGLGYEMNVIDSGATNLAINYNDSSNMATRGDSQQEWGLSVSQSLADYGTTLTFGLERFEYDTTAANYEDITAGFIGVSVGF